MGYNPPSWTRTYALANSQRSAWDSLHHRVPRDGAVIAFEGWFDAVSKGRTRITQPVLSGNNAAYVNQVQGGFDSNLADGMRRIADAMERAERSTEAQALRDEAGCPETIIQHTIPVIAHRLPLW